ncbi:MocR-like pyridoxine biosynthesis transcription factor PdxR [Flavobacterium microcysteis]|uniref:PLP-dependent aminotransferase family protein n=1 Tax=Flavobacterium microcysteis TaxID=2596891 RepID=A0A501QFJ5_9FLAO|nr:PLP-dependent aminotransferase family protein [Flavobacterium microcysteis]TPD71248.1 PLP-dependent aminotransferase family protein [Flavobacterium microcysteis]
MFPFQHIIIIDKKSKIPLYRQIAISIINEIRTGTLKAGAHLPGTRELSKKLGVHRKTVIAAFDELSAQDWIVIVPRKHVTVSKQIPTLKAQKWNQKDATLSYQNAFDFPLHGQEEKTSSQPILSAPEIFIDDGYPDIRLSPIDELLKIYRSYTIRKYAVKNAIVGTTQGTLKLREELVSYLSKTRGLNITTDNLLITHGAQMSIYLASQILLDKEATIIIGNPDYPIADKTFERTKASVIEVAVDENGLDIHAIEKICKKKKITAVYIIPHHHYPTTVTLSVERRMKLLELSNQYSFTIIEDDYDYDYHYSSSPYLPIASGSHNGNVIYIGSFSKVLGPSIRIGFMVAPKNFIEQCIKLREVIDYGGDGYMQNALAELIQNGDLSRYLKKTKKSYHQRRDYLDALLKKHLGSHITYALPDGGMAIWIKINSPFLVSKLESVPQLHIKRIDKQENAFRFGFASMNEKELEEAVLCLREVLRF